MQANIRLKRDPVIQSLVSTNIAISLENIVGNNTCDRNCDVGGSLNKNAVAAIDNLSHVFMADIEQDLEHMEMIFHSDEGITGPTEFTDYFTNLQRSQHIKQQLDSDGDLTPISARDDVFPDPVHGASVTQVSSSISDEIYPLHKSNIQKVENIDKFCGNRYKVEIDMFQPEPLNSIMSTTKDIKQLKLAEKDLKYKECNLGSDKWGASKEAFLDISNSKDKSVLKQPSTQKSGTVLIKESYIEPPKICRISKSLDGKLQTSQSLLNISTTPRRASDSSSLLNRNNSEKLKNSDFNNKYGSTKDVSESVRKGLISAQTIKSPTCSGQFSKYTAEVRKSTTNNNDSSPQVKARFITTLVKEDEFVINTQQNSEDKKPSDSN